MNYNCAPFYWVYKTNITASITVQMIRWDNKVWDINLTCQSLGNKCLELLGAHYLTGSNNTYLFNKCKTTVIKTLKSRNFSGLDTIPKQLMAIGQDFIGAVYGCTSGTSMAKARPGLERGLWGLQAQAH